MKMTSVLGCALALMVGATAAVADPSASLKAAFNKVPTVDVPAKAADVVAQAKASEREATAVDVVKVTLQKSPTVAPAIVGAIVQKSPETAPAVAATAAKVQPKQLKLIAQAAAAAAPEKAGAIAEALCKALPTQYREIALAVSAGAPKSSNEILTGVAAAIPTAKGPIDQAISTLGKNLTVAKALEGVVVTPTTSTETAGTTVVTPTTPARGPSFGPPYVPLSGSPNNVPAGGGVVPPGGRTYAAP